MCVCVCVCVYSDALLLCLNGIDVFIRIIHSVIYRSYVYIMYNCIHIQPLLTRDLDTFSLFYSIDFRIANKHEVLIEFTCFFHRDNLKYYSYSPKDIVYLYFLRTTFLYSLFIAYVIIINAIYSDINKAFTVIFFRFFLFKHF